MAGLSCLVSHSLIVLSLLVVARMLDRELQAIELMTLAQAGWKVWTRARQGEKMFTLWSDPTVATGPSISHRCSPVSMSSCFTKADVCCLKSTMILILSPS